MQTPCWPLLGLKTVQNAVHSHVTKAPMDTPVEHLRSCWPHSGPPPPPGRQGEGGGLASQNGPPLPREVARLPWRRLASFRSSIRPSVPPSCPQSRRTAGGGWTVWTVRGAVRPAIGSGQAQDIARGRQEVMSEVTGY